MTNGNIPPPTVVCPACGLTMRREPGEILGELGKWAVEFPPGITCKHFPGYWNPAVDLARCLI